MAPSLSHANPATFQNDADPLTRFLELSKNLFSLIATENAIYSDLGSANFETYIGRKTNLMQDFEKEAQNLLNFVSMGLSSSQTRLTVSGEVERIREALKINSVYQLKHLKAKIAAKSIKAENFMSDETAGRQYTCH